MNEIYPNAEVTIIALYGKNSYSRLLGVSSIPRSGFQQVSTKNGRLVTTPSGQRGDDMSRSSTFPPMPLFLGTSGLLFMPANRDEQGTLQSVFNLSGHENSEVDAQFTRI